MLSQVYFGSNIGRCCLPTDGVSEVTYLPYVFIIVVYLSSLDRFLSDSLYPKEHFWGCILMLVKGMSRRLENAKNVSLIQNCFKKPRCFKCSIMINYVYQLGREVFFHAPYSHANNVAPSIPRSIELECKHLHYFPDLWSHFILHSWYLSIKYVKLDTSYI